MIDAIVDGLLKGMGVAGWIIGLMAVMGIFLLVVGLFCYVMLLVFGGEDEEDGEEDGKSARAGGE